MGPSPRNDLAGPDLGMIFRRRGKEKVVRHKPRCSFCGKLQADRVRLVAGPGVYICSECISVANDILRGHNPPAAFAHLLARKKLGQG